MHAVNPVARRLTTYPVYGVCRILDHWVAKKKEKPRDVNPLGDPRRNSFKTEFSE